MGQKIKRKKIIMEETRVLVRKIRTNPPQGGRAEENKKGKGLCLI